MTTSPPGPIASAAPTWPDAMESEFLYFSSIASTAFLTIFITACDKRRRSQTSGSISAGVLTEKAMSGFATSNRKTACRRISRASSTPKDGLGIRAELEHSSNRLERGRGGHEVG